MELILVCCRSGWQITRDAIYLFSIHWSVHRSMNQYKYQQDATL